MEGGGQREGRDGGGELMGTDTGGGSGAGPHHCLLCCCPVSLCHSQSFIIWWLVVGVSGWRFSCIVVAVSVCGHPFIFTLGCLLSFGWLSSFVGSHLH